MAKITVSETTYLNRVLSYYFKVVYENFNQWHKEVSKPFELKYGIIPAIFWMSGSEQNDFDDKAEYLHELDTKFRSQAKAK